MIRNVAKISRSFLLQLINYHGYLTVPDVRSIVLRKVLGFAVNLHVEISEIFLLRGNKYVFIHVDCVNFVLGLKYYGIFWIMFERMDS